MSVDSNVAPIIIKKKKVSGGDGHHGGAWKVAYADFVTAMMAFFLLMWLLNATTEQQRKGIADYFNPTVPITRISGGGNGMFGGDSVFSEDVLPQNGTGAMKRNPSDANQARGNTGTALTDSDSDSFRMIEDALLGRGGESFIDDEIRRHVLTRVTDEGLVIELFDQDGTPLFTPGTSEPTPILIALAEIVSTVSNLTVNAMAVEAHARSEPIVMKSNPVWDLSATRANRMRRLLQAEGIAAERMRRVTGHADRETVVSDPMNVRNNRLEVILLRSDL